MLFPTDGLRQRLKLILGSIGLLRPAQSFLARRIRRDPLEPAYAQRFQQFKRQYGHLLRVPLNTLTGERKIALVSSPPFPEVEIHLSIIKALELAGFMPVVLIPRGGRLILRYYRLTGAKHVYLWSELFDSPDLALTAAEDIITRTSSAEDLLGYEYAGARVGRFAISSLLRQLKLGTLDIGSPQCRQRLLHCLAEAMSSATAAQSILRQFLPQLVVLMDTVYTPEGELFDNCLLRGLDTIVWTNAHKSNSLKFKRYSLHTREDHPAFLSPESWNVVREMSWTHSNRERLNSEIRSNYENGDWYSIAGTQFNKHFLSPQEIRDRLRLDLLKQSAFIFPHIPWDSSFFWVKCLFRNYEEWFIRTVRAACANDHVNWIIKIHPANIGKRVREGFQEEIAEVAALHTHVGDLPSHVHLMPADSDISTLSLFEVMDYCLTVAGTVGVEAARLGIPVLTGGMGPYSHKGFTIDSNSREEYLARISNIHHIPRLSPEQHGLAERYAYAFFLLRPLPFHTAQLHYEKSYEHFSTKSSLSIRSPEDWYHASDIRALADWINSRHHDFLSAPVLKGRTNCSVNKQRARADRGV